MSRRVAVVDAGSNTLKFSVTEVEADGSQTEVDSHAETVRLGYGLSRTGKIDPERALRAVQALKAYEVRARRIGAEAFVGVATEAMRQASNGDDVLRSFVAAGSWKIDVISGDEEAELAFNGLRASLPEKGDALIVDIGGGSTEIISVRDRNRLGHVSVGVGSGTLADRIFTNSPPGKPAVALAAAEAKATFSSSPLPPNSPDGLLILSGGNGQFLEAFVQWQDAALPFSPEHFGRILDGLAVVGPAMVAAAIGISVERAQVLPAGSAIAAALIDLVRPATLAAAPSGLRFAIVERWHQSLLEHCAR